eukprot:gene12648-18518_t
MEKSNSSDVGGVTVQLVTEAVAGGKAVVQAGKRRFVSVEFPGALANAADPSGVLKAIGGVEKLAATLHAGCEVPLQLRLGEQSRPIYGDRVNCSRLLLKVTRKRRKISSSAGAGAGGGGGTAAGEVAGGVGIDVEEEEAEEEEEVFVPELIGTIASTYKFEGMADFQFAATAPTEPEVDLLDPSYFRHVNELRLVPPVFSREVKPQPYWFRGNTSSKAKNNDETIQNYNMKLTWPKKRRNNPRYATPQEILIAPDNVEDGLTENQATLIGRLNQLFAQRPIWAKAKLATNFTPYELASVMDLLGRVAYRFSNGPFRGTFTRHGYDPRQDKASFIYQTFDFRVRSEDATASGTAKQGLKGVPQWSMPKSAAARAAASQPKPPEIFDLPADWKPGQKAVKRQQLFQLCDIKVPEVEAILNKNTARGSCNDKDGWLQKDVYPNSGASAASDDPGNEGLPALSTPAELSHYHNGGNAFVMVDGGADDDLDYFGDIFG